MSNDEVYPESGEIEGEDVEGPDISEDLSINEMMEAYQNIGFQATHLSTAVDIVENMREDDAKIYLTFTSNIISSGLREVVAHLVKNDYVDVVITTSGSHTEDIIKCMNSYKLGDWSADEEELREKGINRLGNLYVPSQYYVELEEWLNQNVFPGLFDEGSVTPSRVAEKLGEQLVEDPDMDSDQSVLANAYKNDIPVYCPALTDAEIGNFMFYYQQDNPEAGVEILDDWKNTINESLGADTTGIISVGAGVPKHHAIMSNLFRGGTEYAVYISTGMEGDGSLSGAPPKEAVSWGKIKENKNNYVEVEAEATLVFPLLAASAFD